MDFRNPTHLAVLFAVSLAGLALTACGQSTVAQPPAGPPPPELQIADSEEAQAEPPTSPPASAPEPAQAPPPPMAAPPPPTDAGQIVTPPQQAPVTQQGPADPEPPGGGQWTYTTQYGWIWMPYSRDYTYVTADNGTAYEYAYYPSVGWKWVYAPWVLGWGPRPYWGRIGPAHFAWYSRPWFRVGYVHRGPAYHRRYAHRR